MSSLYERLGGSAAIEAAVALFYDKVLKDPILKGFFEKVDKARLRRSQIAFMTMAFGGPHKYTGQKLRAAHAPLVKNGLSNKHFDAVAGHLVATLKELGVKQDLIDEAVGIVATTRGDVLGG